MKHTAWAFPIERPLQDMFVLLKATMKLSEICFHFWNGRIVISTLVSGRDSWRYVPSDASLCKYVVYAVQISAGDEFCLYSLEERAKGKKKKRLSFTKRNVSTFLRVKEMSNCYFFFFLWIQLKIFYLRNFLNRNFKVFSAYVFMMNIAHAGMKH